MRAFRKALIDHQFESQTLDIANFTWRKRLTNTASTPNNLHRLNRSLDLKATMGT